MSTLLNDIRYSLRMSAKYPGTTAVAVLSLALAIGPNTTLFSVVDKMFLRPPPIQGLSEVYQLSVETAKEPESPSYPDFQDYQAGVGDAAALTGFLNKVVQLTFNGRTEFLTLCTVSENLFTTFGVRPAAGRALAESDKVYAEEPPVMISYRLWQRTFEGDPALPGKSILLNGRTFRVVGVVPRGFRLPGFVSAPADVWAPFSGAARWGFGGDVARRDVHQLTVWARLRNRADKPRVEAALCAVAVRLAHDSPRTNHALRARLRSQADAQLVDTKVGLMALSLVGLVLLIACANVAGVLLAQGEARRREFAVRLAMGARAGRVVRQLLTESMLFGIAAAALGTLMAAWLVDALPSLLPPLPMTVDFDFQIDGRVLAYTLAVSFAAAIACGLFPALRVARRDLVEALKGDAPHGRFHWWFRGGLLVGQIAVAQFLLVGAALLTRSYVEQQQVYPGFDAGRKLVAADVARFDGSAVDFRALRDKLLSVPGVRQATFAMRLPLSDVGGGAARSVFVPGVTPEPVSVGYCDVGAGYFSVMGTRMLRGREFLDHEPGRPAIINDFMARRFWGGADAAMGRFLRVEDKDYQVTGVAEDGKYSRHPGGAAALPVPARQPEEGRGRAGGGDGGRPGRSHPLHTAGAVESRSGYRHSLDYHPAATPADRLFPASNERSPDGLHRSDRRIPGGCGTLWRNLLQREPAGPRDRPAHVAGGAAARRVDPRAEGGRLAGGGWFHHRTGDGLPGGQGSVADALPGEPGRPCGHPGKPLDYSGPNLRRRAFPGAAGGAPGPHDGAAKRIAGRGCAPHHPGPPLVQCGVRTAHYLALDP